MREDMAALAAMRTEIISQQNEIIDELFRLLLQHVEAEELAELPTYQKMQEVAGKQQELERH